MAARFPHLAVGTNPEGWDVGAPTHHSELPPLKEPVVDSPLQFFPALSAASNAPVEVTLDPLPWPRLHPLLSASILSAVSPLLSLEDDFSSPEVDWFACDEAPLFPLAKSRVDPGFNYVWSPPFVSYVVVRAQDPFPFVKKFLRDGAKGAIVLPCHAPFVISQLFDELMDVASLVFTLPMVEGAFLSPSPAGGWSPDPPPSLLWLAVVVAPPLPTDSDSRPGSSLSSLPSFLDRVSPPPVALHLPSSWRDKFKDPTCPFVTEAWRAELAFHPDRRKVASFLNGIRHGWSLNFRGRRVSRHHVKNQSSLAAYKQFFVDKRKEELAKGFRCGPFPLSEHPPLYRFVASPCGLVFKRFSKKPRITNNASYPYDDCAVNYDSEPNASQKLEGFATAVKMVDHLGVNTVSIQVDVRSAFQNMMVKHGDWHLQGELHDDGWWFAPVFIFGARRSVFVWDVPSKFFEWALRRRFGAFALFTGYVDNFLPLIPPLPSGKPDWKTANALMDAVLAFAAHLGVPLGDIVRPTLMNVYLGLSFDSVSMKISLPLVRRQFMVSLIKSWLCPKKRSFKFKDLASLIGVFHFATQALPWGKAFLGRLIAASSGLDRAKKWFQMSALKRSMTGLSEDLLFWDSFLSDDSWDGSVMFHQDRALSGGDADITTDASSWGCGVYHRGDWISFPWSKDVLAWAWVDNAISMPLLELLAVLHCVNTFAHLWAGSDITLLTDCKALVGVFKRKYSRVQKMQHCVREVGLLACRYGFNLTVKHIPGVENTLADLLSRNRFQAFLLVAPWASASPTVPLPLRTLLWVQH